MRVGGRGGAEREMVMQVLYPILPLTVLLRKSLLSGSQFTTCKVKRTVWFPSSFDIHESVVSGLTLAKCKVGRGMR